MSAAPSYEEIGEKVRGTVALVLSLRPEAMTPQSRLLSDLNAESLDLLDLRFRLEEAFRIRITQADLARAFGTDLSAQEFDRRFTIEALTRYVQGRLEEPGE